MFVALKGILSVATQVGSLVGVFDKTAAVVGSALGGKSTKMEPIKSGSESSTTLIAGRGLFLGAMLPKYWWAFCQMLPDLHSVAGSGSFTLADYVMLGSGFLMAVQRYKTTSPVSR